MRTAVWVGVVSMTAACSYSGKQAAEGPAGAGGGGDQGSGGTVQPTNTGTGGASSVLSQDQGCPDLFLQDQVRSYTIELAKSDWEALNKEFMLGPPDTGATNWYPVTTLRLGDEERHDAAIKLRGNSSWREAIAMDASPKAQFTIAFDKRGGTTPFHGVNKIVFDMPHSDLTMLNQRLAYAWIRHVGLPAPCASSAELVINGQPYGVFVAVESWGGRVLKRMFPEAPQGVLLKAGWHIEANDGAYDLAHVRSFWGARDVTAMEPIVDMQHALRVWASEAILNDADGYYGGEHNFMIYEHPQRRFLWLSDDTDATFHWISMMQHPLFWWAGRILPPQAPQHYSAVMADAAWRAKLADAISLLLQAYDVTLLQSWLDTWSAQIAPAVERDPNRPFTVDQHAAAVAATRAEMAQRAEYLRGFLQCRSSGGTDADGDKHAWCDDCDDNRADVFPGAKETCDGADNNCDGVKDDGCPAPPTPTPPASANPTSNNDAGADGR